MTTTVAAASTRPDGSRALRAARGCHDDEDGNEDDAAADVRLLYDAYEPKETRQVHVSRDVSVRVTCARDGGPGALQSGVWLWPAATTLAEFVVEAMLADGLERNPRDASGGETLSVVRRAGREWGVARRRRRRELLGQEAGADDEVATAPSADPLRPPLAVVELGAGAGLCGLAAARALQVSGRGGSVLITDRDLTTVRMVRESVKACGGFGDGVDVRARRLEFGAPREGEPRLAADLVLGSDLIYASDVAALLVRTLATRFDAARPWSMLLASSFRHPETTRILDEECARHGLERVQLVCEGADARGAGDRVQLVEELRVRRWWRSSA